MDAWHAPFADGAISHDSDELQGTAGFGFWNAPFGDPTIGSPALPQAAWFFFASAPNDLPFPLAGAGRGWFVATLDAATWPARLLAPLAPMAILLNNIPPVRKRLWAWLREQLAISHQALEIDMRGWHRYRLWWRSTGCRFEVDNQSLLETRHAPSGPLGFVAWIDNQFLVARETGRFRWGTLPIEARQWLELADLEVELTENG